MGSHLVPDLDDELMWALVRIEELLLTLDAAERDPRHPVRVPPVVSGGRALGALCRVHAALAPTQSATGASGLSSPVVRTSGGARRPARWIGSGGDLLRPFALVDLDPTDLTLLSRTATCLGYELALRPRDELARILVAGAELVAELSGETPGPVDLVVSLARILGLLDLAATDDTALLVRRLRTAGEDRPALTDDEQDAHRRTLERVNDMWGAGTIRS